jgi:ubiquinone/menaquinone biosynthesis C-methylase UbiE
MNDRDFPFFSFKDQSNDVKSIINPSVFNPYSYVSRSLRKAYESTLPKHLAGKTNLTILDYGCGVKPYQYIVAGVCKEYIGADVGDNPKAEINLKAGELLPLESESVDVIISSQVLEHVEEYDKYMSECFRVLKKDGLLFLSTHGTWQFHAAPYDFNRWTHLGLRSLLGRHGFDVLDCVPVLGQLAIPTQLRLAFFESFANMTGAIGRLILKPVAFFGQLKLMVQDKLTPQRVKDRDSAIFLLAGRRR